MPLWSKILKPKWLSSADKDRTVATPEGWVYLSPTGIKETLVRIDGLTASTVPAQFATGNWSVADGAIAGGGRLVVTISALPANGGEPITAIQYRVGTGAWVSAGRITPGTFNINGLTNGTVASITLRAVNVLGPGTASAAKTATPTAAP